MRTFSLCVARFSAKCIRYIRCIRRAFPRLTRDLPEPMATEGRLVAMQRLQTGNYIRGDIVVDELCRVWDLGDGDQLAQVWVWTTRQQRAHLKIVG